MESFCYWLIELAEVYTHHAGRHGPYRLLPAEVLPTHDCAPGHGAASPQGAGCDRCTAAPSTPTACSPQGSTSEERHTMAHNARHRSGHNRHGAVDRDRLREEIHRLEMSLGYWQARWQHTPSPSDPGTSRDRIQHMIDLLHQELGLKQALDLRKGSARRGVRVLPTREYAKGGDVDDRVPVRDGRRGCGHRAHGPGGRALAQGGGAPEDPVCFWGVLVPRGGLMWSSTNHHGSSCRKEVNPATGSALKVSGRPWVRAKLCNPSFH
jgi:hypothetical protein